MAAASLLYPLLDREPAVRLGSILSTTCHRIPERCIPLPWGASGLCARCTAFWAGIAVTAALPRAPLRRIPFLVQAAMILPMVADGSMQLAGLYESTLLLRTATGLLAGAGASFVVLDAASLIPTGSDGPRRHGGPARHSRA